MFRCQRLRFHSIFGGELSNCRVAVELIDTNRLVSAEERNNYQVEDW
jgi:hypothetical protein